MIRTRERIRGVLGAFQARIWVFLAFVFVSGEFWRFEFPFWGWLITPPAVTVRVWKMECRPPTSWGRPDAGMTDEGGGEPLYWRCELSCDDGSRGGGLVARGEMALLGRGARLGEGAVEVAPMPEPKQIHFVVFNLKSQTICSNPDAEEVTA